MEKKPWYKTWWGLLTCILIWPLGLSLLIWHKTNWSNNVKVLVIAGIIIAVFAIGSLSPKNSSSTGPKSQNKTTTEDSNNVDKENKQEPSKVEEKKQESTNKPHKIMEDVRVGDVRWKVIEVKDMGDTLLASQSKYASFAKDKKASGKFVMITTEVENLGKKMVSVTGLKVTDDQNREFIPSTDTTEWIPEGKEMFILSNLNPNVPQQFTEIYEVPANAKGLKLKVGDLNIWSGNEEEIVLE